LARIADATASRFEASTASTCNPHSRANPVSQLRSDQYITFGTTT
jgi:hypothetical protein